MTINKNQNFPRVRAWAARKMTQGSALFYWFLPLNANCTDWRGGWCGEPSHPAFQGYVLDLTDNKIYDNFCGRA